MPPDGECDRAPGAGQQFPCEVCGKSFKSKVAKNKHFKIHLEAKHSCKFCGKIFRDSSNRNAHEKHLHVNEIKFKCPDCDKEFKYKKTLREHQKNVHHRDLIALGIGNIVMGAAQKEAEVVGNNLEAVDGFARMMVEDEICSESIGQEEQQQILTVMENGYKAPDAASCSSADVDQAGSISRSHTGDTVCVATGAADVRNMTRPPPHFTDLLTTTPIEDVDRSDTDTIQVSAAPALAQDVFSLDSSPASAEAARIDDEFSLDTSPASAAPTRDPLPTNTLVTRDTDTSGGRNMDTVAHNPDHCAADPAAAQDVVGLDNTPDTRAGAHPSQILAGEGLLAVDAVLVRGADSESSMGLTTDPPAIFSSTEIDLSRSGLQFSNTSSGDMHCEVSLPVDNGVSDFGDLESIVINNMSSEVETDNAAAAVGGGSSHDELPADLGIEGRSTNNSEGGLESGEHQDMNMEQSKKYVCTVCGKKYRDKSYYRMHHKTHLIGKQYKCQTCGKEFEQKKTLKRHELYFHQELSSQTVCTQCGKRFKHPQSLKDHLVLHAQGEAFDGKPKTYSNEVKQEALNHLQNHTKAEVARILNIHYKSINNWEAATKKKFVCRFCGKKLCSEQRLKQHESSQHENNKE